MAWERHDVTVLPLMTGPELEYASPYLMRRFSTSTPFESASEAMLDLASSREGQVVSHVTWHPFVCRGNTDYVDKLRDGWHPKETLQANLADDGAISIYGEFDHTLYNECEWVAPNGTSGNGNASLAPTPMLCNEEDRQNTSLRLAEVTGGDPIAIPITYCQAFHLRAEVPDPEYGGAIANQFIGTLADGSEITLSLYQCWSAADVYPVDVVAAAPSPGGCRGMIITVGVGETILEIPSASGHWTLWNGPALRGGAHQISDVDLVFAAADGSGRRFSASGHVDLPIVKMWMTRLR